MPPSPQEVTQLLLAWSQGQSSALDRLIPLVYDELKRLAHRYIAGERPDHSLQTTALVNEAYMRLIDCSRALTGLSQARSGRAPPVLGEEPGHI
jgi:RNA polymerase sigma-70 factor, ECF subfamily